MALFNFHRVLIAASIVFDAGFSWWCFRMYQQMGDASYLAMLVLSTVLLAAFVGYLIWFHRKTQRMRYAMSGVCFHCHADMRTALLAGDGKCPRCGKAATEHMQRVAQVNLEPM